MQKCNLSNVRFFAALAWLSHFLEKELAIVRFKANIETCGHEQDWKVDREYY